MQPKEVHFFSVRGRCFAYDVHTTACAEVNRTALSLLPEMLSGVRQGLAERYAGLCRPAELRACLRQCRQLLETGLFGVRPKPYRHRLQTRLLGVCLHVAHHCNLRCAYCYAEAGSFGRHRGLMGSGVLRRAIDFALAHSDRGRTLDIGFFGGEPLVNFERVREGVLYARQRAEVLGQQVSFSLTSNATLLRPDVMEFLAREQFSLIFSLDGPRRIHDRLRRDAAGRGTHALVLRNIQRYRRLYGDGFTVRGTFTRLTPDFSEQVLFLNDQGFQSVSVEPSQISPPDPLAISSEADILRVKLEYDHLADLYLERWDQGRPLHFFHFDQPLRRLLRPDPLHTQCGAGGGYVAVTPEGKLFPCFEAVVEEENCIGDLETGFDPDKRRVFQSIHAGARAGCKACWLRHHCGGGCHAFNIRFNRDIQTPYQPYCEFAEHRLTLAAWMLSEVQARGRDALRRLAVHVGLK